MFVTLADQSDTAHSQRNGMEDRLHNWGAWKRKEPLADAEDARTVDATVQKLSPDDKAAVTATYVQFPYQSVYYVCSEISMPPSWINRAIEKVKRGLA